MALIDFVRGIWRGLDGSNSRRDVRSKAGRNCVSLIAGLACGLAGLGLAGAAAAQSPPTIAAVFNSPTVQLGGSRQLQIILTNPNGSTVLTGLGIDPGAIPSGMNASTPATNCPGATASYNSATKQFSLSGGTLGGGASCQTTLTVTPTAAGDYSFTTGTAFATGVIGSTSTTGTLSAIGAPTITAAFSPASVATGSNSTLTLTLANPNPSRTQTGVAVSAASLPTNLTGSGLATTCGGTATYNAGSFSLSGGTLAAGATCTVTLSVSSTTVGDYSFTTGTPSNSGPVSSTGVAATTPDALSVTGAAPTVIGVSPAAGPTSGGTTVVLTGTDFTGVTGVAFGATPATAFTFNSATSITATAPAGLAGTVDVRVTTASGASATSAADQYTYIPAPTVTSISPTSGPNGGGTTVTLTGTNFSTTTAVTFGATAATGFTVNSATRITATAPAGTGTVDIRVTTAGGTSATSAADQYTYIAAPAVTSISPTTGPTTGGTAVTLTGTGFTGVTAVTFGATPATGFTFNSATSITATAPAGTGTVDIRVTTAGGTSATTAADQFTYAVHADLAITVTDGQTTVTAGGATTYVISVANNGPSSVSGATVADTFPAALTVTWTCAGSGGGACMGAGAGDIDDIVDLPAGASVTYTAEALIAGAATGSLVNTATVTAPAGVTDPTPGDNSATDTDTLIAPTPTVTAIAPTAGPSAGGTTVTVTGTVFTDATAVTFGATPATGFTVNSATSITATAPAGTGTVDIRVTTAGGTSATSAADQYTWVAAPTVTSISPTAGPATGGTTVTIMGSNFSGSTAVTFGATPATGFTVISGASITATAPAGTGTVDIRVTSIGGTSNTTAADQYTYAAAPAAANVSGLTAAFNAVTPIDLSGSITGSHASIAVSTAPTHGTTSIAGDVVTYIPAANYAGADSFAYTATGLGGTSAPATVSLTVSQGAQTITFNALSDASLSASPLTLSATASSGLTVSFTSTTTAVCTVSGATLTLLQAGTCSIDADQAGDASWTAAPTASRSFAVTPANLVIAANAASGTAVGAGYSQTNPASGGVSPYTYALTAGAFPPGTTLDTSTGTVSGTPTVAGTFSYIVQATDSQATPVSAGTSVITTTIAQGAQTIGFTSTAPASASVGGASYTPTAAATSGLGVTFSLDGTSTGCALSGGAVDFTSTGTCRINASQAGDSNWNAAVQVQQSFTIGAASAIDASIDFSPTTLVAGAGGVMTIHFSNDNASTSPAFNTLLTADTSVVSRISGAPGGTCAGFSGSVPTMATVQFSNVSVPSGGCTITIGYRGVAAGSGVGFTLAGFTPAGYPATATAISNAFVVTPSVTSVAPASGPVNQVVTVTGTGFRMTPSANTVTFGAAGAGTVTAASATQLTVTAPATGSGAVDVTVTVNGQTSATGPTFTFLDPPVAANVPGVAVAYDSSGTAIDLSASITGGSHDSIAIGAAPAHGTTSIAGDVVTYIPAAGYFGADSFAWTATGPGGTSAAATVSLTVGTPPAPTVADVSGVAVAYNSSGAAIDLSASVTGVHTSLAIGAAPAHGTVSVAGDVVTYIPAAGYFGADSFTWTATGPGGTSAAATVSLTVATPAAPTVADKAGVAVAYNSSGAAIDLSASVTGVHSSLAIGAAPSHGTTSVAGDVVTYTPAAGYFGADSFTWTATGPGGTSAPATVTLTVATPPAPTTADRSGVAVTYNSAGSAIDLSGSVTGVHTSLAIGAAPTHGTVSVAGDVATYIPANAYFGADSFTWTATGPGGTSAPATVTLSVATPPPPVVTPPPPVTAPPPPVTGGTGEVTVDLGAQTTGVIDGFRVSVAAQHGTATVETGAAASAASAGAHSASPGAAVQYSLVYVPAPGFMGTDTVTVVAFGPGGDSAPATFAFQIPGKAPDLSGQTPSGGSVTFTPTAGLTGGPFQALRITRAPDFGTAVVQGLSIVFTPGVANGGPTSLDYVIDLPFGSSAPGRIALTSNLVPVAQALTASTVQGRPVTVRISDVQGGPFTGATVVSVSPATAGAATIAQAGTAWDLTFTPTGAFSGQAVVTYTLTNAFGAATSTVAVTVEARPDPSLDPDVRGIAGGQVATARRFADAQIGNVQRRLQDLHDGDNGSSNGLSLNLGFGGQADGDNDPRAALRRQLGRGQQDDPGALGDDRSREMLGLDVWAGRQAAPDPADPTLGRMAPMSAQTSEARRSAVGVWSAGSVDWGRQDADGRRDDRFTTQGVTAGLDVRVSDQLIVGAGLGYGEDRTRIGDEGSLTTGEGVTGALYASWRPAEAVYLDGMLGYADLDFASRRWTQGLAGQPDGYATGERSGDVRFASAAFGRIARSPTRTSDLYARVDAREITLDGFVETGAGLASLAWDAVEQTSLSASLGASWRWTMDARSHGQFTPSVRVEWSHELENLDDQGVRYADWAASPTYLAPLDAWSRDSLRLDLGADWTVTERLMLSVGYRGMIGDASESHGAEVRIRIGW